jgi:hypothetical protein
LPKKKRIYYAIAFIAVVTIGQVYTLNHYNNIVMKTFGGSATPTESVEIKTKPAFSNLKKQYSYVALSDNEQYAAYIDGNNVLHITDLTNNRTLLSIKNTFPVDYITWVRNDSVLVGEKEPNGSLFLKRVDITTGYEQPIHTFTGMLPSDDIQQIAFSTDTNDTYVLIGNKYHTAVYHFDTNGHLTTVDLGGRLIKRVAVTQTGNTLYFEDYAQGTFNVGMLTSQGHLEILYRNRALVAVVGNTLYIGTINSSGLVTHVYKKDEGGSPVLVKTFQTPVPSAEIRVSHDGEVSTQ